MIYRLLFSVEQSGGISNFFTQDLKLLKHISEITSVHKSF